MQTHQKDYHIPGGASIFIPTSSNTERPFVVLNRHSDICQLVITVCFRSVTTEMEYLV